MKRNSDRLEPVLPCTGLRVLVMAKMQKLPKSSITTSASSYGSCKAEVACDQFPAGLRVLVVDDDAAWLKIVEKMLRRCMYKGKFHLVT